MCDGTGAMLGSRSHCPSAGLMEEAIWQAMIDGTGPLGTTSHVAIDYRLGDYVCAYPRFPLSGAKVAN
jgi:hypothetical protein